MKIFKNKNLLYSLLSSLFLYVVLTFCISLTIREHNDLNKYGKSIAFEIDKKMSSYKRRSLSKSYTFILKVPYQNKLTNKIKFKPLQVDVPVKIFYQYNVGDKFEIIYVNAWHKYILPGQNISQFYLYLIGLSVVFLVFLVIYCVALIGYEKRKHNRFILQLNNIVMSSIVSFIGFSSLYTSSWQQMKFYGIKYAFINLPATFMLILSIGIFLFSIFIGVKLLKKEVPKLNEKLQLLKKGMRIQGKVLKKEIKGQFIMFEYEFLLKQQRFSKKIHQSSLYKGIDDISNDDRINIFYDYKNPARNVWEFE